MIPVALDQVIAMGMAKNPDERFRTAGELAAAAHSTVLTGPEQRLETTILRQADNGSRLVGGGPDALRAPSGPITARFPTSGPATRRWCVP